VLILPDFSKPLKITTDASISSLGFEISQVDDKGQEHPVAFDKRSTHQHERNYGITVLELLSLIFCLKQYRTFFVNNTFEVVTDHLCLPLHDETDFPQQITVSTQTDLADSLTTAMIDSAVN
jgi:hypothetical protein